MKHSTITLVIFLLIGLIVGSVVSELLTPLHSLSFLTKSTMITWQPRADLDVIKYDIHLNIKINLLNILGLVGAFFCYRKL